MQTNNASFQGPVVGLSYRFGGHKAVEPVAVTEAPIVTSAPVYERPVASNSTSTGKAENRRVDVYIHR